VETNSPPAEQLANTQNLAASIGWAILILATIYVCYLSHLGAIGLVGPDEPRYAWIARDMAETGNWITPRLYGRPWFEKPPLYYWGAALSFKLFGVSEAAARLPSAISALLATLALAWLALRLYGRETARWLLLLLPTTVGMIGFSHAAATDMPFSATLTIAMVAAAVLVRLTPASNRPSHSTNELASPSSSSSSTSFFTSATSFPAVLFGFFLGLAVLAKGPAAILLCGGAAFFWALFTRRWRDAVRLLHPASIATFCLTAFPWYILCARNPDFLRIFIIEHNFKRFLTPEFQHVQPFWFYVEVVLVAFLPWTGTLVWALIVGSRRVWQTRRVPAATAFLLCWAGCCVAFFTISQSKLPGYILPAIPAIGLVLCRSCTSLAPEKHRSFGLASLAMAALLFGLCFGLRVWPSQPLKNQIAFAPLVELILLVFALASFFLGAGFFSAPRKAALAAGVFPILVTFGLFGRILASTPAETVSPRHLAQEIQAQGVPIDVLRVSGLRRSTLYGLNFYLRSDLQDWDGDPSREIYLLAEESLPCKKQPQDMVCSDLWGERERIDSFRLLHLTPKTLVSGRPRSGQPQ
jgi:4-amino-4-deoxy-L-arabinose transferase-like glycosyltransferase